MRTVHPADPSEQRQMYAFRATASLHPLDGQRVCDAVLRVLGAEVTFAVIDAYSDYDGELTPAARAAQAELRSFGAARRRGDTGMGIELDLRDPHQREWLRTYGPWSINADLWGGPYRHALGGFHDSSHSLVAALTPEEGALLGEELSDLGRFEAIERRRSGRWGRRRRRSRVP